jgi:hypothetical protein
MRRNESTGYNGNKGQHANSQERYHGQRNADEDSTAALHHKSELKLDFNGITVRNFPVIIEYPDPECGRTQMRTDISETP